MPPIPLTTTTSYATLTAMITPALFMTATASLIISTSNRVSRIVDRIRTLNDQADLIDRGLADLDLPMNRLAHLNEQLRHLTRRSDMIRFAMTMLYLALIAFIGTSLSLGVDVLLGSRFLAVPTVLAIVGVILMLSASLNLARETVVALTGNRQEVKFYRSLRDLRRAEREPSAGA